LLIAAAPAKRASKLFEPETLRLRNSGQTRSEGQIIIGAGIAGNAAAWALAARHPVTVYEKDARPGGLSHTVDVDYDGRRIAVDTGFIVYNEVTYPEFTALFDHLGVDTLASDMSFSMSADGGRFEWAGSGNTFPETLADVFA
jgi:predicted NAD/FAD-binding protein